MTKGYNGFHDVKRMTEIMVFNFNVSRSFFLLYCASISKLKWSQTVDERDGLTSLEKFKFFPFFINRCSYSLYRLLFYLECQKHFLSISFL